MAPVGTIVVTGANGGLGSAIVSAVKSNSSLAQDYYGLYAVRNPQTATQVQATLRNASHVEHVHELVALDLGSLSSVRSAASEINRRVDNGEIPRIRALILNAGWQEYTTQTITKDGFDMAFHVNYLGHFLLTLLLLQSLDRDNGRIVVVGSWSHDTADPRGKMGPTGKSYAKPEYETIFTSDPWNGEEIARGRWSSAEKHPNDIEAGYRRYGASKLCEVMMMRELSRRITMDPALSHVSILGVDPGAMATGLGERGNLVLKIIFKVMMPLMNPLMSMFNPNGNLRTTSKSAGDVVRAAFGKEDLGDRPNGLYLDGSAIGDVGAEAKDKEKCKRLWVDSLKWAGVKDGDTVLEDWR